jgi:DNA-binding MarR family transcriptional regulator
MTDLARPEFDALLCRPIRLHIVTVARDWVSIADIARSAGDTTNTCYHQVKNLEKAGYVKVDRDVRAGESHIVRTTNLGRERLGTHVVAMYDLVKTLGLNATAPEQVLKRRPAK